MKNEPEEKKPNTDDNKNSIKRMAQVFLLLVFTSTLLFLSAGRFDWVWGWIYVILYLLYIVVNASILPKELMAERGKSKYNIKNWDKILKKIGTIPGFGLILIAGLDERFSWTRDLNVGIHLLGLILFFIGSFLFSWSMVANKYFSTMVRIQVDRNHKVASGGPYKFIRHPGYSGFILNTLGVALILGSVWALIPAFVTVILFIIRTKLEDQVLFNELDGYKEFSKKTRYRLIPGIW